MLSLRRNITTDMISQTPCPGPLLAIIEHFVPLFGR